MSSKLEKVNLAAHGQQEPLYKIKFKGRPAYTIISHTDLQQHPEWRRHAQRYYPPVAPEIEDDQDGEQGGDAWYGFDAGIGNRPIANSVRTYQPVPGKPAPSDLYEYHPGTLIPRRQSARTAAPATNAPTYTHQAPTYSQGYDEEPEPPRKSLWRRIPVWMYLLFGVVLCILGRQAWLAASQAWQLHQDQAMYGYPRTYQCDAVIGQGDDTAHPSHVIVLNLHGKVKIIILPAGEAKNAVVISGPQLIGTNTDLAPVTVTFQKGVAHPSMTLNFQGGSFTYQNKYVNGKWQFVPPQNQ